MIGRAWRRLRDAHVLKRRPIPDDLWRLTLARFPFLAALPDPERAELQRLSTLFLAQKEFHGANGLQITDDMAIAVAAQACLPVLRLGLDWYDGFVGIVMHRGEVVARREVVDDDGVVHAYDETLTGEAMQGGPVMLSWADVADAGESARWGYNVVIHEFAHVIDMRDGLSDGMPPLTDAAARSRWATTLVAEFDRFCERVDRGEDTLLDPYGAEGEDEFFAVAVESFFVSPTALQAEHSAMHELFVRFFGIDPARWSAEAAPAT